MTDKEHYPDSEYLDHPSAQVVSVHDPSEAPRRGICHRMRAVTAQLKLDLVLENKGNVARDHLASERTYLTYVQTSLACTGAGIALVQLFTLSAARGGGADKLARLLGASIVLFGLVILVYGLVRYFRMQAALVRGYFPVAQGAVAAMAFVLVALVGAAFGVIMSGMQS